MAPHDERSAAFGKRLPEELEVGRNRSLRNQCGRQVGDRAADESLVVIGRRTRIEFDFGRMVVAAAGSLQRLAGTRGIGAVLVLVEEPSSSYNIAHWKAVEVDGKTVKADTWYRLKNGELMEAGDDE